MSESGGNEQLVAARAGATSSARADAPLRICFVSADYPTLTVGGIGGIGGHSYTLAHAIAGLGHDVTVIGEASDGPTAQTDGRVRVHAICRGPRRQWKLGRYVPVPWLRWSYAVNRKLRELHAERPLDLVVFPDAYGEGFRFSLAPFLPYVVRFGGPASVVQQWDGRVRNIVRTRIEAWLERTPAARASALLCASRAFADQISREWQLDPTRFRIVRNPLNLDRFSPAGSSPRSPGERVLFVGHIQKLKGVEELVAAVPIVAGQHPTVRFQMIGNDTSTGPNRTSLRRTLEGMLRATAAADRVQFLDPLPQTDLPPLYRDCSVFVLPSHNDVYPNAVLEAMGCGRPVVVSSATGTAELVSESKCGIVVPPNDSSALAAAISEILAMPEPVRNEMGGRGRHMVEQVCAAPFIAAQAIAAYREAILQHRFGSGKADGARK